MIDGGENLFFFSVPTGYPNVGSHWLSGMMLLRRFELASYAAENWSNTLQIDDSLPTSQLIAELEIHLLPGGLTEKSRAEVVLQIESAAADARVSTGAQMIMLSPEFLRF